MCPSDNVQSRHVSTELPLRAPFVRMPHWRFVLISGSSPYNRRFSARILRNERILSVRVSLRHQYVMSNVAPPKSQTLFLIRGFLWRQDADATIYLPRPLALHRFNATYIRAKYGFCSYPFAFDTNTLNPRHACVFSRSGTLVVDAYASVTASVCTILHI